MKAITTPSCEKGNFALQIKDILITLYFVFMVVFVVAMLLEVKIYFNVDVVPGMDIPIDEWYAQLMH